MTLRGDKPRDIRWQAGRELQSICEYGRIKRRATSCQSRRLAARSRVGRE